MASVVVQPSHLLSEGPTPADPALVHKTEPQTMQTGDHVLFHRSLYDSCPTNTTDKTELTMMVFQNEAYSEAHMVKAHSPK